MALARHDARKRSETLLLVIERLGGVANGARALGISVQALSKWNCVPLNRVAEVAQLTGLSADEIRPDLTWEGPRKSAAQERGLR